METDLKFNKLSSFDNYSQLLYVKHILCLYRAAKNKKKQYTVRKRVESCLLNIR